MFFLFNVKSVVNQVQVVLMVFLIYIRQLGKNIIHHVISITSRVFLFLYYSEKYQIFIDLFNVSSYLIPQHFLPKVIEPVPEPATSISSLRLQESPQISIHNHDCPLQ